MQTQSLYLRQCQHDTLIMSPSMQYLGHPLKGLQVNHVPLQSCSFARGFVLKFADSHGQ